MNSFIFQIVVLWSSALCSHKQNGFSSSLLSMFFQGPLRFTDLLRFGGSSVISLQTVQLSLTLGHLYHEGFLHLLATLGSRLPACYFPIINILIHPPHATLSAQRKPVPTLSQARLDSNGKRKEQHRALLLDKCHLYILRHPNWPSVTSAGNYLEAGRLTELSSLVSECSDSILPKHRFKLLGICRLIYVVT